MENILSTAEEILGTAVRVEAHRDWAIFWCPFHNDASREGTGGQPNFGVNLQSGYWKCLRCGASGGSLKSLRTKLGQVPQGDANWKPSVTIVGLPDTAVQESRERVQTAVKNAGLHFPRHRIVFNLSPVSIRKEGPAYDLPIALGVIMLGGHLPSDVVDHTLVVGELSLDGVVRHTRGLLPMAATARANGYKRMFVPEADAPEAALIPDLEVISVKSLGDLYNHLAGRRLIQPYQPLADSLEPLFANRQYIADPEMFAITDSTSLT